MVWKIKERIGVKVKKWVAFRTPEIGKFLNSLYGIFVPTTKSATLYLLLFIYSFVRIILYENTACLLTLSDCLLRLFFGRV